MCQTFNISGLIFLTSDKTIPLHGLQVQGTVIVVGDQLYDVIESNQVRNVLQQINTEALKKKCYQVFFVFTRGNRPYVLTLQSKAKQNKSWLPDGLWDGRVDHWRLLSWLILLSLKMFTS